jgi:hypothetical protein
VGALSAHDKPPLPSESRSGETPADATHLPVTDAKELSASRLCKPSIGYSKHYLQSVDFSRAQGRQIVRHHQ